MLYAVNATAARHAFDMGAEVYKGRTERSAYLAKGRGPQMGTWDEATRVYGGETRKVWYVHTSVAVKLDEDGVIAMV